MKKIFYFLASLIFSIGFLFAQNTDPWITQAYRQLYNRVPSSVETQIKNYNNGTWSSYCELVQHIAAYNRNKGAEQLKGDPWIFKAYCELFSRAPIAWELNVNNYNNGTWNSYDELKKYIQDYSRSLSKNGITVIPTQAILRTGGKMSEVDGALFLQNGKPIAANLISKNGGSLVAAGGGNIVAAGAGNLIGLDGATLVGNDGASLKNLLGVSFTKNYNLMGFTVIRTAGSSALVIK